MAMPNGDANDINTLLHWIKGDSERWPGGPKISAEQTLEAGRRLAGKAYKALSAGITPNQVAVELQPRYAAPSAETETLNHLAGLLRQSPRLDDEALIAAFYDIIGQSGRRTDPIPAELRCRECGHLHDPEFICELDCIPCAGQLAAKQEKEDTEDDEATPEACQI